MRVSNAPADMKYIRKCGRLEISRNPVRMKFVRKCGREIEFDRRGELCTCSTCQ